MKKPWAKRLYLRIWFAVVGTVVLLTAVLGWLGQMALQHERERGMQRVGREIVLRSDTGEVLAQAPARPMRQPGQGWVFELRTPQGETLLLEMPRPPRPVLPLRNESWWQTPGGLMALLVLVAVAVAVGAFPVVRRLTQRLEALQQGVERWGQGDLSTRLVVQGQDEVAFLAERFNAAAERVQGLVQVHKTLLANASHELRSPLTRIRLALELMSQGQASESQRHEVLRNLDELDQLIGEILLASRLDATGVQDTQAWGERDNVDLIGLGAELASQHGAELVLAEGLQSLEVMGHHRLLHRLLRNLLENAKRYGQVSGGQSVELVLARRHTPSQDWAVLQVADRGPGVPQAERRRIFEPFYRLRGASEREGGVGLGLALVQSIAERHGGSVQCLAREGGGAVFEVQLPL
jgi:two-component system OmpR family sensor kinase